MRITSLALIFVMFAPVYANAGLIEVQIGDQDGFGLGTLPDESFPLSTLQTGGGDGTDLWFFGSQSFSLSYDASDIGTITSASLEVFAGGLGWLGIGSLYFDGTFVGQLTDGDINASPNNYARLDFFDLMSLSSLLDGSDTFTISTNRDDGWALDYMKLTVEYDSHSVPEPGTLALFSIGLAAMGLSRGRKRQA